MNQKKSNMDLNHHILETMFEKSLFSDLSLAFFHSSFPFTMRFDVHKAIVAQSPFFKLLLDNTHRITTIDTTCEKKLKDNDNHSGTLHLTIDLIEAMTRRGFVMAPFQHIIRRQWQKPLTTGKENTSSPSNDNQSKNDQPQHILSSHLRFALKWLYTSDRTPLVKTLTDEDTLRVLCVAVLFDLEALVDDCLQRYTTHQLSIDTVVRDLETICQLPRNHKAYNQLRDAALLLLLRYGPDHPRHLARLPVDYMSDVLSADLLFVGCEYERYCLLREVLVAFMQSVGKITWTNAGPVDQDSKRLSGFVRHPLLSQDQLDRKRDIQRQHNLSASDVRQSSQKRKRIPSEELIDIPINRNDTSQKKSTSGHKQQRLSRLSFSACVPFERLVADASSGGVIDKATILSYLLRTTVNYSNMTFDQLSIVREDGIVDESIVFRALWQREALERLLFPFNYQQSQSMLSSSPIPSVEVSTLSDQNNEEQDAIPRFGKLNSGNEQQSKGERRVALDEYFDVDNSDDQERRRRILLGSPRFRFCATVQMILPSDDDLAGWDLVELVDKSSDTMLPNSTTTRNKNNDDDDDDVSNNDDEDKEENVEQPYTQHDTTTIMTTKSSKKQQYVSGKVYNKIMYSEAEYILGHWHRVRVEAQILPRSLLQIQDDDDDGVTTGKYQEDEDNDNGQVVVCRFELQRDRTAQDHVDAMDTPIVGKTNQDFESASHRSKIRYAIYCLNRHEGLVKNDQVDVEDRVLVPVSEVTESDDPLERSSGYVGQIKLDTTSLGNRKIIDVDMMVALEIFGFHKV
ncbi:uncharacterized protein BX664DRAFT_333860 [Halteromyces radiatus]|uniref:uncharacterized protein n=1 Tax=Halteromyces radiatus TaxID=101107 RepID=UPI00221ECCB8|nr:uncharacterized protein BX664DRAFT_333860 [Halteromyces radiatus]KAI8089775.1 hypothetical protein BX664DRAFT_333860 [Halteromyces radiatus]